MSNLTVANIKTRARQRYNAEDDTFFGDDMLEDAIFDAQQILALEGYVIENTFQTGLVANQSAYEYPVTTLAIKDVRYNNQKIYKTTLRSDPQTDITQITGTPNRYALWDNLIYLYPTPDTSDGAETITTEDDPDTAENEEVVSTAVEKIKIRVYSYPQDITSDEDLIEVPEEFKEGLIKYVLMIMAEKDQNLSLINKYSADWEKVVFEVKKQRKKRLRGDEPARTRDVYFGGDSAPNVDMAFANRGFYA